MIHDLKTLPEPFEHMAEGRMNYNVRRNDRSYAVGDIVVFREFEPEGVKYTGRLMYAEITHLSHGGSFGLLDTDVCVFGFTRITDVPVCYVSSKASVPERPAMWRRMRDDFKLPVVSRWIDVAGEGEVASFSQLWLSIQQEVAACDRVVFYAETDDFGTTPGSGIKGGFVEVGMAMAMNKEVVVVLPGVDVKGDTARPVGSWVLAEGGVVNHGGGRLEKIKGVRYAETVEQAMLLPFERLPSFKSH